MHENPTLKAESAISATQEHGSSQFGVKSIHAACAQLPPPDPTTTQLQAAANLSPQVSQLRQLQAGINRSAQVQQFRRRQDGVTQRKENKTGLPDVMGAKAVSGAKAAPANPRMQSTSSKVVQGYFTYNNKSLKKKDIQKIAKWLKEKGIDDTDFQHKAKDGKSLDGELTKYLYLIDAKGFDPSILNGGKTVKKEFGDYDSADEGNISDGENQILHRAGKNTDQTVKKHSMVSTSEQARLSIREMRNDKPLKNPDPTICRLGDDYFEFTPNRIRKDFGVSNMRVSDKGALERAGKPRTYDVLGKDLDKAAKNCALSMAQMNGAISTLLFENGDASLDDLKLKYKTMDEDCLKDLRELVAILALDIARSHNGKQAIKDELLSSTDTFAARLGGNKPEYGGAQNKKKHGMGGVAYLKNYDKDEQNGDNVVKKAKKKQG